MPADEDIPKSEQHELLLQPEERDDTIIDEQRSTNMVRLPEEKYAAPSEHRTFDTIALNSALISAAIFTAATWIIVFLRESGKAGFFAFHPPFQSLAILLITYGILTLQPTNTPKTKAAGLFRHQLIILYVGFPILFIGTTAVWYNKIVHQKHHFTSWHGKFGLLCIIWIIGQMAFGAASIWYGGAAFGGGMKAKSMWKYHRASGYCLIVLLTITSHLGGAWSNWGAKNGGFAIFFVYTLPLIVMIASILIRVRTSKMKFT